MSDKPKRSVPRVGVPLIAVLAVLAAGLGFWIARRGDPPPAPPVAPPVVSKSNTKPTTGTFPTLPNGSVPGTTPAPAPALPPAATREDEEKLFNWLTGFDDATDAGKAILGGWSSLTEGGRTAAAPHLLNLVPDENFKPVEDLLLAPDTSAEVKEIFFTGLLNRSDEVKWPLILKVMEQKTHPQSEEARRILSVVLNGDYGDDWERWRYLVKKDLLKNEFTPDGGVPPVGAPPMPTRPAPGEPPPGIAAPQPGAPAPAPGPGTNQN